MGKGKRVSNKRGEEPKSARSERIRIGWRRVRAISQFEKQREQLEGMDASKITAEVKAKVKGIKKALGKLIPRKQHKTQARGR